MQTYKFPFSAIVSQDKMKKALLLNVINPRIGGLLINGEKGTAKSTMVRALADLIDQKFFELPLSISEDMLVGTINIEKTIKNGKISFQQGLLGKANHGILYVDEVNLLPDHIVDVILSVASDHVNRIEREGMSLVEESDFILIGTMNSEEGFLRPQFMDQFGLYVYVESEKNPNNRVEILKRRQLYDCNPSALYEEFKNKDLQMKQFIKQARETFKRVTVTEADLKKIIELCIQANVDGHRADIVMRETAMAIAAMNLRTTVIAEDIEEAAYFVLMHRKKTEDEKSHQEQKQEQQEEHQQKDQQNDQQKEEQETNDQNLENENIDPSEVSQQEDQNEGTEQDKDKTDNVDEPSQKQGKSKTNVQNFETGDSYKVRKFGFKSDRKARSGQGKRTTIRSAVKSGRYLYSTMQWKNNDLAFDATIRAAAPFQKVRNKKDLAIAVHSSDIREKVRQKKISNLLVFVVDGSGSMGANQRMVETKGAILSLLQDAYIKRDQVALVVFRGDSADVVLPPTKSVVRGYKLLETIATGGKTPLNAGIVKGLQVIKNEQIKNQNVMPMLIIITDGKGNVPLNAGQNPRKELMSMSEKIRENKDLEFMVIDIEARNLLNFGIAKKLADSLEASYFKLDDLKSDSILKLIDYVR